MKALALFGLFVVGIASAVVGRADESLFQVRPGEEPLLLLAPAPKGGTDLRRFLDQEPVIDRIYIPYAEVSISSGSGSWKGCAGRSR